MNAQDFTVFLRIRHPDIDPVVLTDAFGMVPEHSWKAGEAKRQGDPGPMRRESYWFAEVPRRLFQSSEAQGLEEPDRVSLEWKREFGVPAFSDHVRIEGALMLAALLFERRREFWAKLQAEGASAQLIVVLGSDSLTGFELPRDLLSMLSKSGLSISVDFRDAAEAVA